MGGFGDGTRERSEEGRPPQLWGSGGITPGKFFKFIIQIRAF
jgi:hypothetical protein